MEDQPADSGDLTTDTTTAKPRRGWFSARRRAKAAAAEEVSASQATEVVSTAVDDSSAPRVPTGKAGRTAKDKEPPEPTPAAADEPVAAEDAEADEVPADEVVLVPYEPAGKRLTVAAVAAGVLFVGAAAFAGATVQPYLADRAAVDTKLDVARTAANAISTLWTYTPDNMEALPDRSARFLGGDFANEYRKYIDAIVAPNKQAQVTNTTEVMGAAVESISPTEATALVYTNSVATSPVTKNIPSLRYLSYRLTMQHHDAKWLITRMSTVTSFDLTPQL